MHVSRVADWQHSLVKHIDVLPLFKPVRVKILVVIDGVISFDTSFGLGMMIDTMRAPAYSFVRFELTLATRDGAASVNATPGAYQATYTGFRFNRTETDGTPTIHKFDEIWCFGFHPGNDAGEDVNITRPEFNPTSDAELEVLARWMDEREGGIFATGDHDYLGASMCHRIPRVSTMRRWTNAQNVPPINGTLRHDTNRPANAAQADIGGSPATMPNSNEEDHVPQPLEWKRYSSGLNPIFNQRYSPHPILCDRQYGIINVFPDHPHEGWIFEDAEVDKGRKLSFGGYSSAEYPEVDGVRPLPEVIAWANTLADPPYVFAKGDHPAKRFGVIGVYDGQQIDRGRVVVDSTWHHWFTMNLEGLAADTTTTHYEKIQTYFRNIGIWLARRTQRQRMLTVISWYSMFTVQGVEEYGAHLSIWQLGQNAKDILGRYASRCMVRAWIIDLLEIEYRDLFRLAAEIPRDLEALLPDRIDLVEHAVLGGIIKEMAKEQSRAIVELSHKGRATPPDPQRLAEMVSTGIRNATGELGELYAKSAKRSERLTAVLKKTAIDVDSFVKVFSATDDEEREAKGKHGKKKKAK